jgi:hypothetical protein
MRKRDSRSDLIFLVLLVGVLLGGAWLVGHRTDTPKEAVNESIVKPRQVAPELITFTESTPIAVDGDRLRGLAIDSADRIYVLDKFRILVYQPDGVFVREYELDRAPHCAAFGPDGKLYLGLGRRIGVMDLATETVTEWEDLGEQALVGSIAVGKDSLMAGDSGNRAVWAFDLTGKQLAKVSDKGVAEGEGTAPSVAFDVARASDTTFWATDAGRHAVLLYSATGDILERWGKQGEAIEDFGGCCNPVHLATFPDGRILSVEKKPDLVKVLNPDGSLSCVVAPPKDFIFKTFLADAAVDSKGRAIVLDPKRKQVRIFVENGSK